jgi:hypothetical protein
VTRHTHTIDFTEEHRAMRDLIDRAELLNLMRKVRANAASEGCSAAFILAYTSAIRDVEIAPSVNTGRTVRAFDAEEYAINMKAVAEGLMREIPYGVSDAADDAYASAEAMLEETNQFLAKMGVNEDA